MNDFRQFVIGWIVRAKLTATLVSKKLWHQRRRELRDDRAERTFPDLTLELFRKTVKLNGAAKVRPCWEFSEGARITDGVLHIARYV